MRSPAVFSSDGAGAHARVGPQAYAFTIPRYPRRDGQRRVLVGSLVIRHEVLVGVWLYGRGIPAVTNVTRGLLCHGSRSWSGIGLDLPPLTVLFG
eukprot:6371303-Alexandrium_andersonii.AAC.1